MAKHTCNARFAAGDVLLNTLKPDVVDIGFLNAARLFFMSFANDENDAWVTAILGSGHFFPDEDSAEKMRCVLAVVHEMRTSRRSNFRFSNPRCKGCASIVTADERLLIKMIQYLRRNQFSKATSSAMLLCEGNSNEGVLAAAFGFLQTVGTVSEMRPHANIA